ncbi:glycoside hydrolase family 2 protein [Aureibaculum algae]|uniref:Glycoside hydrolase family 2 protein n=1 Tax=Aureibaculum algae TaxID=2584122 RepID=A0A5B7TVI0_9FLAO|nr:sugar-binding domain-containing protein [Aureibaculum algae]QCX40320.1 glycoside hydrolase family 2 protein [Aureibaculum algae]
MTKQLISIKKWSLLLCLCFTFQMYAQVEREQDFNFDWKFSLDQKGDAFSRGLNDSKWRDVNLPHDWSVEFPFEEKLEGATGYLPGGLGWYRKQFSINLEENQSAFILFDGVYNNSEVWLNGKKLGANPYGYSPFYFDITPFLTKDGKNNLIAVKVDHTRYADSRWYTGSGIYRNVKLITVNKTHIPIWGTYVTTPKVTTNEATVQIQTTIKNTAKRKTKIILQSVILDANGKEIAKKEDKVTVKGNGQEVFKQNIQIASPKLWDTENPNMYNVVSTLKINDELIDQYATPFGIRTLRFTAKEGFFLNDKFTLVKGVCLHHDGGLVGAAVPKGVWKRRLMQLKEAGVNAIRTSHNPFSKEFLDLCDTMGFLVQDEIFDELDYPKDKRLNYHDRIVDSITRGYTNHFQKWGESDLKRTILRDRNHPSIFQWSIGNEIEWTYLHYRYITGLWPDPNDPQKTEGFWGGLPIYSPEELKQRYNSWDKKEHILAETAKRLNGWIKSLDTTRPTIANLIIPQVSLVSGYADAIDIAGFSYRNSIIPWAQKHFPNKQVTITECPGGWDDWKQVLENPGVFSIFMWTGIDYMGESNEKWPIKGGWGEILDLAGFKLQGYNYFKSIWVDEPHISLGTLPLEKSSFLADKLSGQAIPKDKNSYKWRNTNTHWNYKDGDSILVEVASNLATVELFLNDKTLGSRSMSECPDRIFRWVVPYEKGVLTAKAGFAKQKIIANLSTTSEPIGLQITTDKTELTSDGYDVAHIVAQLVDKDGNLVKTSNAKVTFDVKGSVRILGVDNGAGDNIQNFQSNELMTSKGRCLLIVQSKRDVVGKAEIKATTENFSSAVIQLDVK